MAKYIDEGGVENFACAMVDQARKDFIKGGKILYGVMKRIPTQNELYADPDHHTLTNNADVRWMYDAWRFVRDDPYLFFGEVGEESVINAWKDKAIEEYYRVLYLEGATILFHMHAPKKIYELSDEKIIEKLGDTKVAKDFIEAKNYICNLPDNKDLIREWGITAYERSRHYTPGKKTDRRKNLSDHQKKLKTDRELNIKRAKELDAKHAPLRVIAKELGVSIPCVMRYLRS